MIHPSYLELMNSVNNEEGEKFEKVESRYSIVIAAAKRARQLTDGAAPKVEPQTNKVLSTAVDELYLGKIHIISLSEEEDAQEEEEEILEEASDVTADEAEDIAASEAPEETEEAVLEEE